MTNKPCVLCVHKDMPLDNATCEPCYRSHLRGEGKLNFAPLDAKDADLVNHPPHYTGHPSGVECIQISEHMNFCRGNAMKYLWRAGEKGDEVQDLEKAKWYIQREIDRLKKAVDGT